MGLTTVKAIDEWAEKQPKLEAVMRAGSVAVFDGYVLHRGSPIRSCRRCGATSDDDAGDAAQVQQQTRNVLYWGYTKSWYRAEPDDDFAQGSAHVGRGEA